MILRVAAGLSIALGTVALGGYLTLVGKGPFASLEARHLREMKDRDAEPARVAAMDFADFAALPHQRTVAEYSAFESRGASLEGYVQRLLRSPDGDLHLEVAPYRRDPGLADTAYVTAEVTPSWQRRFPELRYRALLTELRPDHSLSPAWEGGPRRVRVTGHLLYDFPYDVPYGAPNARRLPFQTGRSMRVTGWEIHPVTRVEVFDEADSAWRSLTP